jgi:hypothetical protein
VCGRTAGGGDRGKGGWVELPEPMSFWPFRTPLGPGVTSNNSAAWSTGEVTLFPRRSP